MAGKLGHRFFPSSWSGAHCVIGLQIQTTLAVIFCVFRLFWILCMYMRDSDFLFFYKKIFN